MSMLSTILSRYNLSFKYKPNFQYRKSTFEYAVPGSYLQVRISYLVGVTCEEKGAVMDTAE